MPPRLCYEILNETRKKTSDTVFAYLLQAIAVGDKRAPLYWEQALFVVVIAHLDALARVRSAVQRNCHPFG